MSANYPEPDNAIHWLPEPESPGHDPQPALQNWLTASGWLTSRLQQVCADGFRVEVLAPSTKLANNEAAGNIRRVILWCGNRACIYAETAIPDATASAQTWLADLGEEPLGQILETRQDVSRSPFEYALLSPIQIPSDIDIPPSASLWARRSDFSIGKDSLTVTEVFLPGINEIDQRRLRIAD